MQCPFCAETIRDEAILCRFCGAEKAESGWTKPAPPAPAASAAKPVSFFTFNFAGACFLASAIWEALHLTEQAPLFGELRSGAIAVVYHLTYAVVFAGMGMALLMRRPWGYAAMLIGTCLYTLDRFAQLFDPAGRQAEVEALMRRYGSAADLIDKNAVLQVMNVTILAFLACWWGFMLYVHLRRSVFTRRDRPPSGSPTTTPSTLPMN